MKYMVVTRYKNGEVGLSTPPESLMPDHYQRFIEENKANGTIRSISLCQVLEEFDVVEYLTNLKLKFKMPCSVPPVLCKVLRCYTNNEKWFWDIQCGVCSQESTIIPEHGGSLLTGKGLPKYCVTCGAKFTGWGN